MDFFQFRSRGQATYLESSCTGIAFNMERSVRRAEETAILPGGRVRSIAHRIWQRYGRWYFLASGTAECKLSAQMWKIVFGRSKGDQVAKRRLPRGHIISRGVVRQGGVAHRPHNRKL